MKKPNHRLIVAVDLIGFTALATKGFCCPKTTLALLGLINQIR
jgi:hypothetical protein